MEAQSLQLSVEQTAVSSASTSCIPATISANYLSATEASSQSMDNSNQMLSSSSSPSSASSTAGPVVRAGKARATRKTKPRTSPYPVSPNVAANQNGALIGEPQHAGDEYSNPMMDYRYEMPQQQQQPPQQHPNGYHAMYPAYGEVPVYGYAASGAIEPPPGSTASSNHSELYNPYYETDNLAAYPAAIRHYPNMTEGKFSLLSSPHSIYTYHTTTTSDFEFVVV